ncbi:MAG: class I adenylate-forming enzyme family protein, partial [Pseudomonadota bacterium]
MDPLTMSYCYRHGAGIEKGLTYGQMLENTALRFPDNVAIRFEDGQSTYRELNEAVNGMANALLRLGLRRGDRAAILFPDWPEYSIAMYACARIGVVVTPMNPLYRRVEIRTILNHLEAKVFFMPSEWRGFSFVNLLDAIRSEVPSVGHVVVKGDERASWMKDYGELLESGRGGDDVAAYLREEPVEADDLLEISYTSGTTGTPKGAVHTHDTRMLNSVGIINRIRITSEDVWLCMAPLFHATGNHVVQHTAFLTGGTLVLMGRYSAEVSLREIERSGVTIAVGVPTMFIDLMNRPEFDKTNVSSMRYALFTGAPMPPEVALR